MTLTALAVVLTYSEANASGFYLKEQSAAAQGNAYAGATAGAEDISYSYFNPAALSYHSGTNMDGLRLTQCGGGVQLSSSHQNRAPGRRMEKEGQGFKIRSPKVLTQVIVCPGLNCVLRSFTRGSPQSP